MNDLPDSAFVVLAVLAERPLHGYELQRVVHDRGFSFWTQLRRSSSYKALHLLERNGLVTAAAQPGDGPSRKVYSITEAGRERLRLDGLRRLAAPTHPHSELDLAIYALPFLPPQQAAAALNECRRHLEQRADFLRERLQWCAEQGLRMPALAFERPLVALEAELKWLDKLLADQEAGKDANAADWTHYVYREPPT